MARCIGYVTVPRKDKKAYPRAFIRTAASTMQCQVESLESEFSGEAVGGGGERISVFFTVTGTDVDIKAFKDVVKDVYSDYSVQIPA